MFHGRPVSRVSMVAGNKSNTQSLSTLLEDARGGYRLSDDDARQLFLVNDRRIWQIAAVADERRERVNGPVVTYVRNQNINVTNYCINSCGFCGFSKKQGRRGLFLFSR